MTYKSLNLIDIDLYLLSSPGTNSKIEFSLLWFGDNDKYSGLCLSHIILSVSVLQRDVSVVYSHA